MDHLCRFQIEPQIVHETIQGEVVIINLTSGCYYSLMGTGAEIWGLLGQPTTPPELAHALKARHHAEQDEIENAVGSFVKQLEAEGLIVATAQHRDAAATSRATDVVSSGAFVVPVLNKYSDMQDILKIDPIHDVGKTGWPLRPDGES